MAGDMVMLNTRMERSLRELGNSTLAELGITPSQFIRAIWEKLAGDKQEALAQAEAIMKPRLTAEQQAETERKLAALSRIDRSWEDMVQTLGLDPATYVSMSAEELQEERYQHLLEKYGA